MGDVRSVLLSGALALVVAPLAACTPDDGGDDGEGAQGHVFPGTYEVPVAPELASAAVYGVAEVEWTVANGTAKLDYELPLGLVGTPLRVEFTGPLGASATSATLAGAAGTAECTLTGTAISCFEQMDGLLPFQPDYAVIEQLANAEYAGPASDRIRVAEQFAGDPIGIVHFDRSVPAGAEPNAEEQKIDDE